MVSRDFGRPRARTGFFGAWLASVVFVVILASVVPLATASVADDKPSGKRWLLVNGTVRFHTPDVGPWANEPMDFDVPSNATGLYMRWMLFPREPCGVAIGGDPRSAPLLQMRTAGVEHETSLPKGLVCDVPRWSEFNQIGVRAGAWRIVAVGRGNFDVLVEVHLQSYDAPSHARSVAPARVHDASESGGLWMMVAFVSAAAWLVWKATPHCAAFGGFVRIDGRRALDHVRRQRILQAVKAEGPLTLASLGRLLALPKRAVIYHVAVLERVDLLRTRRFGRTRWVMLRAHELSLPPLTAVARSILGLCRRDHVVQQAAIVETLAIPEHVVRYYAAELVERGLLHKWRARGRTHYAIRGI